MIGAIALLFVFQMLGEIIHHLTRVPVPGAVIGMVALVIWLAIRRGTVPFPQNAGLDTVAAWLTRHMTLMFVPAAVGVMDQGPVFARFGLALVLATMVSVVLALIVAAVVLRWALARFAPEPGAA